MNSYVLRKSTKRTIANYHLTHTRLGNKEEDYRESNLDFEKDDKNYKYKIICENCRQIFYRKRLQKNLLKKYRCGKCGGKLILE